MGTHWPDEPRLLRSTSDPQGWSLAREKVHYKIYRSALNGIGVLEAPILCVFSVDIMNKERKVDNDV